MTDTDKVENVKIELTASISVSRNYDSTQLVSVDRKEVGAFTLEQAMALLREMGEAVLARCSSRMDQRITDARRQIEVSSE